MGRGRNSARRRLGLLLASSSIIALTIGGGAPAALAACAINDVGVSVGAVTNNGAINCIFIQNSTVSGDVTNSGSGTITTTSPFSNGIAIDSSTITGGVTNAGQIAASAQGIWVTNNSAVSGAISNAGAITVTGVPLNGELHGSGVLVGSVLTTSVFALLAFTGGISNSGTIVATGPRPVAPASGSATSSATARRSRPFRAMSATPAPSWPAPACGSARV